MSRSRASQSPTVIGTSANRAAISSNVEVAIHRWPHSPGTTPAMTTATNAINFGNAPDTFHLEEQPCFIRRLGHGLRLRPGPVVVIRRPIRLASDAIYDGS